MNSKETPESCTVETEVSHYFADDTGEVVSCYSREQAIADGVLIDVGPLACEFGFNYPIAVTSAAWASVVEVGSDADEESEEIRLRGLLRCLRKAVQFRRDPSVGFIVRAYHGEVLRMVSLKAMVGPGDDGETPVITIMLLGED